MIISHDQRIRNTLGPVLWLENGRFKELARMATDPVCGMSVDLERAVAGAWDGRMFHFCSRGCKAEFMVDTALFVSTAPDGRAGAVG